jgi:hypothetical protein
VYCVLCVYPGCVGFEQEEQEFVDVAFAAKAGVFVGAREEA